MMSTNLHCNQNEMEVEFRKGEAENCGEYFTLQVKNEKYLDEVCLFLSEKQARQIAKKIYDLLEGGE